MRITNIFNEQKIREYLAIALDTTVENTSEYAIVNAHPEEFDYYHNTGTVLHHDSFDKILMFNIIKVVNEKMIVTGFKVTTIEALGKWKGKNEAERVQRFTQWLDVHVYNLVEVCVFYIQNKEQELTGNG